jgi:hypothetical protein
MQKSNLGIAAGSENTERSAIANPQQSAEQFALENPEEQGKLATAAGIGAGGIVAPAAASAVARAAAKHPMIAATVASEGIRQARNIPYVGKLIPPYAEMAPFLFTGKGKAEGEPAEPDATEENRPFAGEPAPKPQRELDATGENKPFAGGMDEAPPVKVPPAKAVRTRAPNVNEISPEEWEAGRQIEPQVENTPRSVVIDPKTGAPEFSDVVAAKAQSPKPEAVPAAMAKSNAPAAQDLLKRLSAIAKKISDEEAAEPGAASDDLTQQLQDSLTIVRARKALKQSQAIQ